MSKYQRRGVSLVWIVVILLGLIGMAGLACDTGWSMLTLHQLQNAADASALAGAQKVKSSQGEARLAAMQTGAANVAANAPVQLDANDANDPQGDIVLGRYDRPSGAFTPTVEAPNAVKVVAARRTDSLNGSLPLIFGRAFGVDTIDVDRSAIALYGGGTGAGMIALCQTCECALTISGNPTLRVNGGPIQVNSSHACAVCARGSGEVIAPEMNVVGGVCTRGGSFEFHGDVNTGQPAMSDPLENLIEPAYGSNDDLGAITSSGTYVPGFYAEGMDLGGGDDVVLLPGIYVLAGSGLQIGGNAKLYADGVMCFVPPGSGLVNINGTGEIVMTPVDPDRYYYWTGDLYEGMTIFQGRTNSNESTINGTGLMDLQGTLYFPGANLRVGGTGAGYGNQLIAHTIEIFGTGDVTITYDGRNEAAGTSVFLVE